MTNKFINLKEITKLLLYLILVFIISSSFIFSVLNINIKQIFAATEDFTTWTEVDVDGRITVTSSSINMTTISTLENKGAWVYRDMGAAHYGDTFSDPMTFEFAIHNTPANNDPFIEVWGLANVTNPGKYTSPFAAVAVTEVSRVYLYCWDDEKEYKDYTSSGFVSVNTTYYCTINRASNLFTLKIYSDSKRTTLLDTLTCDDGSSSYRYVFGFAPYNTTAGRLITATVSNLDIAEPANPHPTVVTNEAQDKTLSSANLSGTVSSSSSDIVSWGVEIGTKSGVYTDNQTDTGTESAPFDFSFLFEDLENSTHYYARAFASNELGGINYGSEIDFYTIESGAIILGDMTLDACEETVGVIIDYEADSDGDSTVILQYSTDNATWHTAPTMWNDTENYQYKGKVFWLTENTLYYIRATFSDGTSIVGTNPILDTITTMDGDPDQGTIHTYHVAKTGNDTTGDGSSGSPWLTVQKAANTVIAGDTVYVHAGTYSEMVTITADGNSSNFITFMPYSTDEVIIDGGSSRNNGFYLNSADYVRISGFTIQNTLKNGFLVSGCSYSIIDNNTINDPTVGSTTGVEGGVRLDNGSDHMIIRDNDVTVTAASDVDMTAFTWWYAGSSNVFHDNTVTGNSITKDGFGGGPENSDGYMNNSDIYDNVVTGVRDDGIQLEGSDINTAVWGNTLLSNFIGIGFCPVNIGPNYVFRNVIVSNPTTGSAAYKLGDGSFGRVYIYHNTSYTTGGQDGYKETNPGTGEVVSRNNIVISGRYVFEFGSAMDTNTMKFDYDCMYTTDGSRFVKWDGGLVTTLAAFQAIGQETHGITTATPGFTNAGSNDFTLVEGSACINAGTFIQGFNDADSPWPYSGDAPDMGAFEYDEGAPVIVVPTLQDDEVSNIGVSSATINGRVLNTGGEDPNGWVYWDTTDHGKVAADWSNNVSLGSLAGVNAVFHQIISSLDADTQYFYIFSANNTAGWVWTSTGNFTTLSGITTPTITTIDAINITTENATIRANLTSTGGEDCTLHGYWGLVDKDEDAGSWSNNSTPTSPLQPQGQGVATIAITSLSPGTTYYFNFSATNSEGTIWGTTVSFITKPSAPTGINATDGNNNSYVTITWSDATGTDNVSILRDSVIIAYVAGGVKTYNDTGADASIITPGSTIATDGISTENVSLSLSGISISNGTTHTYTLIATNASGDSVESSSDTGYRGYGTLTYQWQVSLADSDANYSNIDGATSNTLEYTDAPSPTITSGTSSASDGTSSSYVILSLSGESANNGAGRYYQCILNATGCTQQTTSSNRGYIGVGSLSIQWQRSAADSDADYSNIVGATTDPYNDTGAPEDGSHRYYIAVLNADGATESSTSADSGYRDTEETPSESSDYTQGELLAQRVIPILVVITLISFLIAMFYGEITLALLILAVLGISIGISFLSSIVSSLY